MLVLGLGFVFYLGFCLSKKYWKRFSRSFRGVVLLDMEFFDGDVVVFSCDVVFDNFKIMSYIGGKVVDDNVFIFSCREDKEK